MFVFLPCSCAIAPSCCVCQVELQVVLLTSTKTQIPLDYYHAPYCRPSKITKEAENLGEVSFQIPIHNTNVALFVDYPREQKYDV